MTTTRGGHENQPQLFLFDVYDSYLCQTGFYGEGSSWKEKKSNEVWMKRLAFIYHLAICPSWFIHSSIVFVFSSLANVFFPYWVCIRVFIRLLTTTNTTASFFSVISPQPSPAQPPNFVEIVYHSQPTGVWRVWPLIYFFFKPYEETGSTRKSTVEKNRMEDNKVL